MAELFSLRVVPLLVAAFGAYADTPVAANGRLEGGRPPAFLYFAESGRLANVRVEEGQAVRQGEALAELDCSTLVAQQEAANQKFNIAQRGARAETVSVYEAQVGVEDAQIARLEADVRRLTPLAQRDLAAKSTLEDTQLDLGVARARRNAAEMALTQARNPEPREEVRRAAAEADAVSARVKECTIYAPSNGIILRRILEPGSAVSAIMPSPVILFSDSGSWRARVEVDEADVASVHLGQHATVAAPAFGPKEVRGTVRWLSSSMGRRSVRSGDPGEKMDRDVREVLVELNEVPPAPVIGLRVTVKFTAD